MSDDLVKCIFLATGGEVEAKDLNLGISQNALVELLGNQVTFVGSWTRKDGREYVAVMRRDQDNEKLDVNPAKLQPPMHKREVKGDIVVFQTGEDGNPVDLPLEDWEEFQAEEIAEFDVDDREVELPEEEELSEEDDSAFEGEEEEEDEEEEEEAEDKKRAAEAPAEDEPAKKKARKE